MSILDQSGNPKEGEFIEQDIGGPLCFQGDYLAKGRELPKIEDGDYLIMHDTGGYTYALYSRFNSIQAPGVFSNFEPNLWLANSRWPIRKHFQQFTVMKNQMMDIDLFNLKKGKNLTKLWNSGEHINQKKFEAQTNKLFTTQAFLSNAC